MNTANPMSGASATQLKNKQLMRNRSNLVDLAIRFAGLERPSHSSISMFKEQFYTLVLASSAQERRAISEVLADCIYTPRAIVLFLGMEEIAVSKPVLENSPVLKPADLNSIISKTNDEHARAISARQDLEASTITQLMTVNDETDSIKNCLLKNPHILKNPDLLQLVEKTRYHDWIDEPAENVTSFEIPQVENEQKGTKDLSNSLLDLANRGGKLKRTPAGKKPAHSVVSNTIKQLEQKLLYAARSMNLNVLTHTIYEVCGLKREITASIILQENTGMLASLLRALNISEISAARIMLLLNRNIGRNHGLFKTVMQKFKQLDRAECIAFFAKMGAEFKVEKVIDPEDSKRTRFAMSLAARERREALLAHQERISAVGEPHKKSA